MMQVAMIPAVDVLRKEHHDESVVEQGQQRYKNEDDVLFQEEEQEREQDKFDENTSPLHPEAAAAEIAVSSTHESHEMKRHAVEDNASVQVAIRIRPLLTNEDPHESLQLFASSLSSSSSSSNVMGDTNSHFMKSKTMSESTMATAPESSTSYSDVFHQNYQMLQVGEGDTAPAFTFDHVFPSTAGQEQVYDTCVTPLVESCLEGYNATVLAYGQTGSGKTHTILGSLEEKIDDHVTPYDDDDNDHGGEYMENDHDGEEGVIPRALKDIFHGLQDLQSNAIIRQQQEDKSDPSSTSAVAATCPNPSGTKPFEYCIKIQFVELYGEEIRDLLADLPQDDGDGTISHDGRPKLRKVKTSGDLFATPRTKITIRDGKIGEGAELMGVERFEVKSAREALHYLRMGLARRVVGKTAMNVHSSRSHAIFTAVVHQTVRRYLAVGGGGGAGSGGQSNTKLVGEKLQVEMKTSKMHFVDLCGSERVKRAQTTGKRYVFTQLKMKRNISLSS
jgi:Kinesin-like protein